MKVHGAGPDAARVAAASLGEPAAVEEVVAAGLPVVRAVVRGVLGRHPDADDVVQEAMVRAVRGLPGLREPERFRSWLVTVALREARTWARAHRVHDPVDVLPDLADPTDVADLAVTRAVHHQFGQRATRDLVRPAKEFGHVPRLDRAHHANVQLGQLLARLGLANDPRLFGQVREVTRGQFVDVSISPRSRLRHANGQDLEIGLQLVERLVELGLFRVG